MSCVCVGDASADCSVGDVDADVVVDVVVDSAVGSAVGVGVGVGAGASVVSEVGESGDMGVRGGVGVGVDEGAEVGRGESSRGIRGRGRCGSVVDVVDFGVSSDCRNSFGPQRLAKAERTTRISLSRLTSFVK